MLLPVLMYKYSLPTIPAVALIYGAQKDRDCGSLIDSYEREKKVVR